MSTALEFRVSLSGIPTFRDSDVSLPYIDPYDSLGFVGQVIVIFPNQQISLFIKRGLCLPLAINIFSTQESGRYFPEHNVLTPQ